MLEQARRVTSRLDTTGQVASCRVVLCHVEPRGILRPNPLRDLYFRVALTLFCSQDNYDKVSVTINGKTPYDTHDRL